MFGTILISAGTLMQVYVFWRALSVPFIFRYIPRPVFILSGLVLWACLCLARIYAHDASSILARKIEMIGMNWLGVLFLCSLTLLAADLITGFGFLLPRLTPALRGWALALGCLLSLTAMVQGMRPPVIQPYEVRLSGLPEELDGTVLVAVSDMHLGAQRGEQWLSARLDQIRAQKPGLVVLLGDIFEGRGDPGGKLPAMFRMLKPPLGVWGVLGNHEFYGGGHNGLKSLKEAGVVVLRNQWAEITPGLVLAGVDDLTAARRARRKGDRITEALSGRPPGAAILLSHTPWQAEKAAGHGAGLMLSGHTHAGQIWPFSYLVGRVYPLLAGLYRVDGMPVIVCRGTGSWGPRMRLWRPAEILKITLRSR